MIIEMRTYTLKPGNIPTFEERFGGGRVVIRQRQHRIGERRDRRKRTVSKPPIVSEHVVQQLGGALDRTLAALEPYLLQLRLEMGAANA